MIDPALFAQFTHFGAAGLIGVLWILERRHAALRDRQLDEAHVRLAALHRESSVLLDVVRDNTRAIAALEQSQRELLSLMAEDRLHRRALRTEPTAHTSTGEA